MVSILRADPFIGGQEHTVIQQYSPPSSSAGLNQSQLIAFNTAALSSSPEPLPAPHSPGLPPSPPCQPAGHVHRPVPLLPSGQVSLGFDSRQQEGEGLPSLGGPESPGFIEDAIGVIGEFQLSYIIYVFM